MIKISKRLFTAGSICVLTFATTCAHADVLLTFGVTNVKQNVCSGPMQPDCVSSAASVSGFTETMRFLTSAPLGSSGSDVGGIMHSQAFYGFADAFTGSPYTSTLAPRLSGPITYLAASTDLDSSYDSNAVVGASSALISSDAYSDVTDLKGFHSQQEYKHAFNLSSGIFNDASFYTDLVNESLGQFFNKYIGMTGGFDELGSTSLFNPNTLAFDNYAFAEYTGDAALLSVQNVPEPGTLALIFIAALAYISRFRRVKNAGLGLA